MKSPSLIARLALLIVLARALPAPAEEIQTGMFKLKTKELTQQLTDLGLDKLAVIRTKEGLTLAAKQNLQQWKILGKLTEQGTVNLPLQRPDKQTGQLTVLESKDGSFSGELSLGGAMVAFNAVALGGLYRCGNHAQAHLADDPRQMAELTKANGCARWTTDPRDSAHQLDLGRIANLRPAE